jgi:hypothetical protein
MALFNAVSGCSTVDLRRTLRRLGHGTDVATSLRKPPIGRYKEVCTARPTVLRNWFRGSYFLAASMRVGVLITALAVTVIAGATPIGVLPASIPGKPLPVAAVGDAPLSPAIEADHRRDCGRQPLHFGPTRHQSAEAAQFLARGPGYALFVAQNELALSLRRGAETPWRPPGPAFVGLPEPPTRGVAVLRLGFVGANSAPIIEGLEPLLFWTRVGEKYFPICDCMQRGAISGRRPARCGVGHDPVSGTRRVVSRLGVGCRRLPGYNCLLTLASIKHRIHLIIAREPACTAV